MHNLQYVDCKTVLLNFCPKWIFLTGQIKQSSQDPCCCFGVKNSHLPHSKVEGLQLHAGTNHNDTSYREKQIGALKHKAMLYGDVEYQLSTSTDPFAIVPVVLVLKLLHKNIKM